MNVVLISRTQSKLDTAAGEIEVKFKVKTKTLAVDFGKADAATWSMLKAELADLAVGVLINNVGVSYPHAEYYEAIDDQLIDDLISINVQATNKVTSISPLHAPLAILLYFCEENLIANRKFLKSPQAEAKKDGTFLRSEAEAVWLMCR